QIVVAIFRTSTLAALATSKKYHSLKWPPLSICQFWAKSALGHEQTSRHVRVMTVVPLKADIHRRGLHVRFVPEGDITPVLLLS
ncbi:MAG: hypothetical protein WBZ35_18580, partial [Pseudolabrys sp.]